MTLADLKFNPCEKCGGFQSGYTLQRTILYLTDEIRVRCDNCGDTLVFRKTELRTKLLASAERTTRKQSVRGGTRGRYVTRH